MVRRRQKRGIFLPWEQRSAWLRDSVSGSRFRVALIVVLVAWAAWAVYGAVDRQARVRDSRAAIAEVHRAISAFRSDVGRCPASTTELLHPPLSGTRYLREMPTDGWGEALFVRCPARHDPHGADVLSAGPSGSFFVDDNVR